MKKPDFLIKIKKEQKLSMVAPSEEIKESYLLKSKSNLESAKILLVNNKLEEATSIAYYSMYNMTLALLFKTGIKSENHTASILILKNVFEIDNSKIFSAKKERIDKQYYVNFKTTESEVKDLIKLAEQFNAELNQFIKKMNKENIILARKKFENIITEHK